MNTINTILETETTTKRKNRHALWLALRFPYLPLEATGQSYNADTPIAVVEKKNVVCINKAAQKAGIKINMPQTTAQLLSNCKFLERNHKDEQKALSKLSEIIYEFSPYIHEYHIPHNFEMGLIIEISSCINLFGGIKRLCDQVLKTLNMTPYQYCVGLCHTQAGSWLLSHQNKPILGVEDKNLFITRLKKTPIDKLQEYPDVVASLEKTGFNHLGDIAKQIDYKSIAVLRNRFGHNFANHIENIFGIEMDFGQQGLFEKPKRIYQRKRFFSEKIQFDYPADSVDQLYQPIEQLLQKLSLYLEKNQLQCQHIEWCLHSIYREQEFISVHIDKPRNQWKMLLDLSIIQMEQQSLPFEVDTLELLCKDTTPMVRKSEELPIIGKRRTDASRLELSIAKLKARLGKQSIYKISHLDSHVPENSNEKIEVNAEANGSISDTQKVAIRPHWLFPSPIQIKKNRKGLLHWKGDLKLLQGPERIEGNWWDQPTSRDYFVAKRDDNLRVWVFYDLYKKLWYIHGYFS